MVVRKTNITAEAHAAAQATVQRQRCRDRLGALATDITASRDVSRLYEPESLAIVAFASAHCKAAYGVFTGVVRGLKLPGFGLREYRHAIGEEVERQRAESRRQGKRTTDRPEVIVTDVPLDRLVAQVAGAMIAANKPPTLFRADTVIVAVEQSGTEAAQRPLDQHELRLRIAKTVYFKRRTPRGPEHVDPPPNVVSSLFAPNVLPLPQLVGITTAPIMRLDGSLIGSAGYDAEHQLYYAPDANLVLPKIPDTPTAEDVAAAVEALREPFAEFTWEDGSAFAHVLTVILSGVLRHLIHGPVPMAVISAPSKGTGKGLLVDLIMTIVTGQPARGITPPGKEEEMAKVVPALLLSGRRAVVFDNVATTLGGQTLEMALTNYPAFQARLFGSNTKTVDVPSQSIWIANGNNVKIGGDLGRRVFRIGLLPKGKRPWESKFERSEADLRRMVRKQRGIYLAAVYTLARAWIAGGRKPPAEQIQMGSYGQFVEVVSGILAHAGIDGFLVNRHEAFADDDEGVEEEVFIEALRHIYAGGTFVVGDVVEEITSRDQVPGMKTKILGEAMPGILQHAKGKHSLAKAMGRFLARYANRSLECNLMVQRAGKHSRRKVERWRVVECDESGAPLGPPSSTDPGAGGVLSVTVGKAADPEQAQGANQKQGPQRKVPAPGQGPQQKVPPDGPKVPPAPHGPQRKVPPAVAAGKGPQRKMPVQVVGVSAPPALQAPGASTRPKQKLPRKPDPAKIASLGERIRAMSARAKAAGGAATRDAPEAS